MSIATIVLRGYGTSSYADVHKLPTLGYSSGVAVNPVNGPLIFAAGSIYRTGMQRGTIYRPGAMAIGVSG